MFNLFRRKKVADKKILTPSICENCKEKDALSLQDFTVCKAPRSISEGALSRLSHSSSEVKGIRKGYQKLEGERLTEEIVVPSPNSIIPAKGHMTHNKNTSGPSSAPTRISILFNDWESVSSCSADNSDDSGDYNSDSSYDDDEDLTCNVCDRSFFTVRHLIQHQQKKRHYGCSICDSLFPNLMALEMHKETLDHWSEDDLRNITDSNDDDDDEYYDRVYDPIAIPQELERLL